jgi:uncharacterized protein YndB with AHSA1/START domain
MTSESVSATITIKARAEAIFSVLTDPSTHPAIDGTGRVLEALDRERLTAPGQIFRMAMYHENHWNPDRRYQMANRIRAFDPPHAISWEPGQESDDGSLQFGGWVWRYDLTPVDPSTTEVTLSYDWSAVPEVVRRRQISWPPFPPAHLDDSPAHLAGLVTA